MKSVRLLTQTTMLALTLGLLTTACDRRGNSGSLQSLQSRALMSQSAGMGGLGGTYTGMGTGMYSSPYSTLGGGLGGSMMGNPMMMQLMQNQMYDKYREQARQDRDAKFRQDMLMMLGMKGTELISMAFMAKAMGSMGPSMQFPNNGTVPGMGGVNNSMDYNMSQYAALGLVPAYPNTMGYSNIAAPRMLAYNQPTYASVSGNLGANHMLMANNDASTCPTCREGTTGLNNTSRNIYPQF